MHFLGVDISGDHARLLMAVGGGLLAACGYLAGRWTRHRRRVRFQHEDLVTSSVVIELYAVSPEPDGREMLHIVSQGNSTSLDDMFHSPELVEHIQHRAARHPGLLHLANPIAHRMMMDAGKDAITGLDAKANMDFLAGRPTRNDAVLFAFAAYRENNRSGSRLHDQVARLVLMVVNPAIIGRFADEHAVANLAVAHEGYRRKCNRLRDFALEWQRLSALPHDQRSAATDMIWQVTVRTSLD